MAKNYGHHAIEKVQSECAFDKLFSLLGKKHVLGILLALSKRSTMRFNDLKCTVEINAKSLTSRLQELEAEGLVKRSAYHEIPPRVEYSLTPGALGLSVIFKDLEKWGTRRARDENSSAQTKQI